VDSVVVCHEAFCFVLLLHDERERTAHVRLTGYQFNSADRADTVVAVEGTDFFFQKTKRYLGFFPQFYLFLIMC